MRHSIIFTLSASLLLPLSAAIAVEAPIPSPTAPAAAHAAPANAGTAAEKPLVKKILFIGDSMTGWMAERLNAYGHENGFEVATVIWDGSTIRKWGANSARIKQFVAKEKPDAVFVSLGLNELGERNPQSQLGPSLHKITSAVGDIPLLWVGPPSWPGKDFGSGVDSWLEKQMGSDSYYSSLGLKLSRQSKTNPHPSRDGIKVWIDAVIDWIPEHASFSLPGYNAPSGAQILRPKSFTYRRMKESL